MVAEQQPMVVTDTGINPHGYWIEKSTLTDSEMNALHKELTMSPIALGFNARMPNTGRGIGINRATSSTEFPLWRESRHRIYIPKSFGLKRFGIPRQWDLPLGDPCTFNFVGNLREEQLIPIQKFLDAARDQSRTGGILSLPCGFGKTVAALYITHALGVRTMVIAHKEFLLDQWHERICQFLPGASVGLIKAKTIDVDGRDIILASLQSLSMKNYEGSVFNGIGLLIVDECHRIGTDVFSRALVKRTFPYTLGISATVQRKDGMTKAFTHFLGDVLYKGRRREDCVVVCICHYNHESFAYREEPMIGASVNISRMINNITEFHDRTSKIVSIIAEIQNMSQGRRKVLVLSDRKKHLMYIRDGLVGMGISAGFYWGGMKREALVDTETKQVMCATFAYASEGMDVPSLDTLVLASPKSDVEQSVGRILRQKQGSREFSPMVVDVVDDFSVFARQGMKRLKLYQKHHYEIVEAHRSDEWLSLLSLPMSNNRDCEINQDMKKNDDDEKEEDSFQSFSMIGSNTLRPSGHM